MFGNLTARAVFAEAFLHGMQTATAGFCCALWRSVTI
jgi:hypothetical protein